MKGTIVRIVVGVAAAAALFALLVPTARDDEDWWSGFHRNDPALREALRLRQDRRSEALALRDAWERVDSRERARAVRLAPGSRLAFVIDPRVPARARANIDSVARAELGAVGATTPRHPIAIVAMVDADDRHPRYSRAVVLPDTPADPCVIVLRIPARSARDITLSAADRLLGTCAFYAAYGTPGVGTASWLLATNARTAAYLQLPAALAGDTTLVSVGFRAGRLSLDLRGCRAGRDARCSELFTPDAAALIDWRLSLLGLRARDAIRPTPDVALLSPTTFNEFGTVVSYGLLAALATQLGPDRFSSLWQGDGPVVAYERQEGRPVSAWVAGYVASRVQPVHAGPGLPPLLLAVSLLVVAAAALLAITRSPRVMT